MPRIPVRTTPYHTLPRCTRHYKSKRDLILRALGKASFINGSQFVISWISPKGEVDVYASELLQSAVTSKDGGVLNRKELEREGQRIRGEMNRRWEEIRRLEEKGEAPVMEDDDDNVQEGEMGEDEDLEENLEADRTLVDDADNTPFRLRLPDSLKKPLLNTMMSTFSAQRLSTPAPPMHSLTLASADIETYYTTRFAALQQHTCKLVVKAWIKVIEPKKQMKFPYNKGEELKPAWWPEGVRHREPDHLSKTERLTLLAAIVRSPLINIARLQLATAEAGAFINGPRQAILREVYLVAKEEEKRREEGVFGDLVVSLPNLPVSPSAVSPEGTEKRSHAQYEANDQVAVDKENLSSSVYEQHQQKRVKHSHRLVALANSTNANYETAYTQYGYNQHALPAWRDSLGAPAAHLSPYPHSDNGMAWSTGGSDYSRSPNPEVEIQQQQKYHTNHLAPLLNPHTSHSTAGSHAPSPIDSPAFPQTATMQSSNAGYFGRTASYMQQQQMDYLHAHGHNAAYDYGSPYLIDGQWESSFAQSA